MKILKERTGQGCFIILIITENDRKLKKFLADDCILKERRADP